MKTRIESVIDSRLKMQTVQNQIFGKFKIFVSGLDEFKKTIHKFKGINAEDKKQLIYYLGGPINQKETERYLSNFIQ